MTNPASLVLARLEEARAQEDPVDQDRMRQEALVLVATWIGFELEATANAFTRLAETLEGLADGFNRPHTEAQRGGDSQPERE